MLEKKGFCKILVGEKSFQYSLQRGFNICKLQIEVTNFLKFDQKQNLLLRHTHTKMKVPKQICEFVKKKKQEKNKKEAVDGYLHVGS